MLKEILLIIKSKPVKIFTAVIVALLFFSVIGTVYALNSWDSGYRVNNGSVGDVQIDGATGPCQRVTNNSGNHIFIPTKTANEWHSFNTNHPAGVTIGNCCAANAGLGCSKTNTCGTVTTYGVYLCDGWTCNAAPPSESDCGTYLSTYLWSPSMHNGGIQAPFNTLGGCNSSNCPMTCLKSQLYWHVCTDTIKTYACWDYCY